MRYRLANDRAITAMAGPSEDELATAGNGTTVKDLQIAARVLRYREVVVFPIEHEGLVIDIPNLLAGQSASFDIRFGAMANADFVRVTASMRADEETLARMLIVTAETRFGDAGTWAQPIPSLRRQRSASFCRRDKPEHGDTYKPVGDVIVRARLAREDTADALINLTENRWLSVLTVRGERGRYRRRRSDCHERAGDWPDLTTIRPARLSSFTPSVWCQFAESMSTFRARIKTLKEESSVGCSELEASFTGSSLELKLADGNAGALEALAPLGDLHPQDGEKPSQLEEVMFLVVTEYVTDVFDLLRERPIAVLPWPESGTTVELKTTVWPSPGTAADLKEKSGRVRLLRMLRSRSKNAGGFEDAQAVTPTNLFQHAMLASEAGAGDVDMNPPDARGIVLGISTPIEWAG